MVPNKKLNYWRKMKIKMAVMTLYGKLKKKLAPSLNLLEAQV